MRTIEVSLILLILVKISPTKCLKLTQGDERVKFLKYESYYYELTIDENLADVVLFNVEADKGLIRVDIDNGCSDLQIKTILNKNNSFSLSKPLDYENYKCQNSKHTVTDQNAGKTVVFKLIVENLDDNAPTFQLSSNCALYENTKYTAENTTCSLKMRDLDGMMDETYLTIGDEVNSEMFVVSFHPIPKPEETEATVVIYLKEERTLNYETKNLYVISVNAKEKVMSGKVQVEIDVQDLPDMPPKFITLFTTQQFEENMDQKFFVAAQDGDIGINSTLRKTYIYN